MINWSMFTFVFPLNFVLSLWDLLNFQNCFLLVHPETFGYFQVETSMKNIDLVVREREIALRLLQTGHEKPVPGEWRHDFLGRTFWYGKPFVLCAFFLWCVSLSENLYLIKEECINCTEHRRYSYKPSQQELEINTHIQILPSPKPLYHCT